MKIGCGEWGFRELPMLDHFKICREFGFRTMEIGIGGGQPGRLPDLLAPAQINDFLMLKTDFNIQTPFCCLENDFTLPDPAAHQDVLNQVLRQLEGAAQLGASHVRLFAGFTPASQMTETLWDQMLAAFKVCDDLCAQLGLVISIETHGKISMRNGAAHHEHTVTTDLTSLRRLIKDLPERVGFNYDPGNLKAVDPVDSDLRLSLLNDRINYCHLKDWKRLAGGWIACAPGDDDLDYKNLLPKIKFSGVYLIEYEPTDDVVDGIRRSLNYLRGCFGELEFC